MIKKCHMTMINPSLFVHPLLKTPNSKTRLVSHSLAWYPAVNPYFALHARGTQCFLLGYITCSHKLGYSIFHVKKSQRRFLHASINPLNIIIIQVEPHDIGFLKAKSVKYCNFIPYILIEFENWMGS